MQVARPALHRADDSRRLLEQVRTAGIADEDEVPGEHRDGAVAASSVTPQEGGVLGGSVAPSCSAARYSQSRPPSAESIMVAPVAAASSRAPDTKSAWMWVSVTW